MHSGRSSFRSHPSQNEVEIGAGLVNPPGGLAKYYRENVIGGPGAFAVQIDDFRTFGDAMMRKLVDEISEAR